MVGAETDSSRQVRGGGERERGDGEEKGWEGEGERVRQTEEYRQTDRRRTSGPLYLDTGRG